MAVDENVSLGTKSVVPFGISFLVSVAVLVAPTKAGVPEAKSITVPDAVLVE